MPSDQDEPTPPEEERSASIKRGKSLRLSVHTPPPEESAAPPPVSRPRRGSGLRLSVDAPPPQEVELPPPTVRPNGGNGLRLSVDASLPTNGAVTTTPPQELKLPSGPISYRQAGDGMPLILLHGWGASSRYWLGTLKDLADLRHCYALDLPGFGRSPALAQATQPDRLADVIIDFADALGIAQFDLNGHSFGAGVAACLAARYPDRVRRLVLTSFGLPPDLASRTFLGLAQPAVSLALQKWQPWLNLSQPWLELWKPWQAMFANTPPFPQLLATWVMEDIPEKPNLIDDGIDDLTQMDLRAHLGSVTSVGDPSITLALHTLTTPTLLISGDADRIQPPATLVAAHQALPNSRLEILERCGHVPMIERPALYHRLVREFLA